LTPDSPTSPLPPAPIERVFILRSRVGRNIYVIRGDTLEVSWRLAGAYHNFKLPIRSISSDYEVRGARHLRGVILLLLPVALCIAAYRFLLHHPEWPDFLLQYPMYVGATYALAAIKLYPRFEWFVFKNHFGRPVFTVLREPRQRAECEAFIHALLDRIEQAEEGAAAEPAMADLAAAAEPGAIPKWKMAIAFALFSFVVPPVWYLLGERSDIIVLLPGVFGSGGAIVTAIMSWAEKEHRRRWALVAGLAALIPIFLYRSLLPAPTI
jgi:hypothetical protein